MNPQAAKLAQALVAQGVNPNQLAGILQQVSSAAPVAAERNFAGRFLEEILSGVVGAGLTAGGIGLAGAFSNTGTAPSDNSGNSGVANSRFFINPQYELDVTRDVRADEFRSNLLRGILGVIPGFQDKVQPPMSAQERIQAQLERTERQADNLTEREIRKAQAEGLLAQQLEKIIQEATTERAGIQAGADVQKQRLASSYQYAQGVLENAINGVLSNAINKDRSTETQLAQIM
jgi:hypothetical protein